VITASGHETAPAVTAHALVGLQLNVPHVHIYVQGVVTPDVYGGTFGLRVAW